MCERVRRQSEAALSAYRVNPLLVREHAAIERATTQGGYGRRQIYELVQNGADALQGETGGRVAVVLTDRALYCANEGQPVDADGVDAILSSHLNVKKANEIGRFGIGFKSVLAVSKVPEFYSRSGSFRFDRQAAQERISKALGKRADPKEIPILRTAEPLEPGVAAEDDRVLRELMEWATTVVKLPRTYGTATWLGKDIETFPAEFLLFSPHVGLLTLHDKVSSEERRIGLEQKPDGLLLRADGREELWWIVNERYVPSEHVREDGGVHAERKNLPLAWAVQRSGRIVRGRFWAFFPTETQTTVSGILNAPWKTNEDRQNLLPGPFNEEFIDKAAELVVANILRLWSESEPARHLDLLPSRDSYNWADKLLGERVFALCAGKPIVPDQDGIATIGEKLHLHPEGISPKAMAMWASYDGRPRDWVHAEAETANRRARVERLIPEKNLARHIDWLEALVLDHTPAASVAAVKLAAQLASEAKPAIVREVKQARIVLTERGTLECVESVLIAVAGRERHLRADYVSRQFMGDQEVVAALRALGVKESDPATDLAAFLAGSIEADDEDGWRMLWQLAFRVPAHRLQAIAEQTGWDTRDFRVLTLGGTWEPLRRTLLPGRVVPIDGSRDAHIAIDSQEHDDVLDHLKALGATDGPSFGAGRNDEFWVTDYQDWARDLYISSIKARANARPRREYIGVEELRSPLTMTGPLEALHLLSVVGRTYMTHLALEAGAGPDKVWMSHETTPDKYRRAQVQGPVAWRLRREGRLRTSCGIVAVSKAVGPQLGEFAALLPVAQVGNVDAGLLRLPATLADIKTDVWADATARAASCTDPAALGALLVGMFTAGLRPDRVYAQVGQAFDRLPPTQVTVIWNETRAADLLAHGVPFVTVTTAAHAEQLVDGLGMKSLAEAARFQVIAVQIREPAPLVDEFPPLRWYIPEEHAGLLLARCSELSERVITAEGTTEVDRSYLLTPSTVFWNQAGGDLELLRRLRIDLDLRIDEDDCTNVASRRANQEREGRLAELRALPDQAARLAAAVGPEGLKARLPAAVVEAVQGDSEAPSATALARAALALMGPYVLHEFRDQLAANGFEPPVQWAGSATARSFVRELGFEQEFAGSEHQRLDSLLEVDGPPELPDLHAYQLEITARMRRLLASSGGRGLISLPTGAGKTRVAVQALVELIAEGRLGAPVLWMAETEELCEQAVQAWAYVWRAVGSRDRLRISRLWSANEAEAQTSGHHVVVATVAKLQNCVADDEYDWLANATCVVIDEAHGAIAPVYTEILSWLGLTASHAPRPLIGLTATPYRGTSQTETSRLVSRFYGNRLDAGVLGEDQYATLQEMGVLARVEHELLEGIDLDLTAAELARLEQTRLVPTSASQRLANNEARNEALLASVRKHAADRTILLFAASVEHAEVLAAILSSEGIPAGAISSRTPTSARRHFISRFRKGEIRVLTNYAVLTEGFDAPAVGAVYVARPTYSPNLYQQMIGRGLRGPLNGGKDVCLIVNVRDNIAAYGEALAFNRFEYLWSGAAGPGSE
jgi:superfamily II DNA or RNA helicase